MTKTETQLNETTQRLDELTAMRETVTANLETLQQGFIDRKTSLDQLQSEQTKLDALENSIKLLETKQDELHSAFQSESLSENVQAAIEDLKTIAERADAAFDEYDGLRTELDRLIKNFAENIIAKSAEFYGKKREFQLAAGNLAAKQPGIGIFTELQKIGCSQKSYNLATSEYVRLSPCEFGESIVIAERLTADKKQREIYAANRAAA